MTKYPHPVSPSASIFHNDGTLCKVGNARCRVTDDSSPDCRSPPGSHPAFRLRVSLASAELGPFLRLPLFFMTLTVSKRTVWVFCRLSLNLGSTWVCLSAWVFLTIRVILCLGKLLFNTASGGALSLPDLSRVVFTSVPSGVCWASPLRASRSSLSVR